MDAVLACRETLLITAPYIWCACKQVVDQYIDPPLPYYPGAKAVPSDDKTKVCISISLVPVNDRFHSLPNSFAPYDYA
jgi:hypothetical protein